MIRTIMRYMAEYMESIPRADCGKEAEDLGEMIRVDAKAEGMTVPVAGWRSDGLADTISASWFGPTLTKANAPWVFAKGEPFRVVATLELLALTIGIIVLIPANKDTSASASIRVSGGTDSQGNDFLLKRYMTTKWPLGAVLIEAAEQCRQKRILFDAHWLPRLQNEEADALANGVFEGFDPARRVPVDMESISFLLLPRLLADGEAFLKAREAEAEKKAAETATVEISSAKRRKKVGLRESDPW